MRILIIYLLMLTAFAEDDIEPDKGLFFKKKADFLEKMKEEDNPEPKDIECVEKATNRNELNRCKKYMEGRRREEKTSPYKAD